MNRIPFDESKRDVWHDASVEEPDKPRDVLVYIQQHIYTRLFCAEWSGVRPQYWRELPAPPKPTPKIVPHSLSHWHDPKVERPEPGRRFVVIYTSGLPDYHTTPGDRPNWDYVRTWSYCPEATK